MPNLVEVHYEQTGASKSTNEFGMRQMQQKAYEQRDARYLLLKAPPASGKSRALMFIALDKLINQGIKKVIVAVPERSIGGSFGTTDLKSNGFYSNWEPNQKYNLCTTEDNKSKVETFKEFLESDEKILICTHATLRFAFDQLNELKFNDTLLAIDEFHHVSADGENRLGEVLRSLIEKSNCHIVAMTGSYFRGDSVPVLLPEDEVKFTKVTYNYYEQLNGYDYLKSLGIGYHFYQGKYTSAIDEILDTDKKTILHIPNVNSGESTKDKHKEVDTILDIIGHVEEVTEDGVIILKRKKDGKLLKVADLVNDNPKERDKIVAYLRNIKSVDDMDLIIALGMAKEGFDWPYCEHALTVGYRSSLTEIIQIIGRATRDSENKTTSQFTNLIAQPDAHNDEVKLSVNNMLKAITSSLLMEQVLAPSFKFKPRFPDDKEPPKKGELKIRGFKTPTSKKVQDIIESDLNDLKASILQDEQMLKAMPGNIEPEVINEVLIPKIIKVKYPDLNEEEIEELRQYVVVDSVVRNAEIETQGDKKFIRMADKFINLDDLNIDLINSINPFQQAFEILSKQVTTGVLKIIQEAIEATRIKMDFEEASILWPKIQEFIKTHGKEPSKDSNDPKERRMYECIIYLKEEKRKRANQ
ncbi:DEAD/DEAH box helicase [Aliarcobacter cryaerophilus]|uniref:DEAD/DEAH box helicase family protein n=1 Tax=Aliarcobacter cryaerophilus TaxID=28198 RepID=A0AA46S1K2_9BACT|nr:DEAD/DEAH box helicase [Aliarcobacter cryaerophilus]UYF42726.1 DEAD/DEAH box helicase family protein [Aliarcobacter cryaerophilus]